MFSLTQKSLVKKRLQFQDMMLSQATLFPMFSSAGKVEELLIVDHVRGKVYWLPWAKGLVFKPWFGPVRIARKFANLEELPVEKAYHLTRFWLYDPWWLLAEAPFKTQETTPPLKETNCVDHWQGISAVCFTRDLSRVNFLSEPQGDGVVLRSLKDKPLPPREEIDPPMEVLRKERDQRPGGWRLKPFWQRPA